MDKIKAPADALDRFFSKREPGGVVSVYLFGSHGEARAHRESDVDIALLLDWKSYPGRRERFEQCLRLSALMSSVLGTDAVDTIVLNDAPPRLGAKIMATGKRLFCSNHHLDQAFLRDIQLRSADLSPFLDRTRRIKLAVIQE